MRDMFFTLPLISGRSFNCCLKIENAQGDELSLALDNSAGAHGVAWRGDLRVFDKDGADLGEPITGPTPEQFLERLATHLGYTIRPLGSSRKTPATCPACGTEQGNHPTSCENAEEV